jgi:hypothetical protein
MPSYPDHALYNPLLSLFFAHDLARLADLGVPEDEYQPEVDAFIERLPECTTRDAVEKVLREEFVRLFTESVMRGADYTALADDVWLVLHKK